MNNPFVVTPKQLKPLLADVLLAKRVPMIEGSPGIGKSNIVMQLAEEFNLEPIIFTLSNRDSTDLSGYPTFNNNRTRSSTAPPDYFPIEGDPLPEGKNGWLIFLDEIKDAAKLLQASANQLILDRRVGFKKLHSNVAVVAAGNLMTDNAAAIEVSTAMQSRMVHFELKVSNLDWLDWGKTDRRIDYRVLSFIQFKPDCLHMFDPDHEDKTFACPRTWEMMSDIIKPMQTIDDSKLPLIVGTIGRGSGLEFKAYLEVMHSLPDIKQILTSPEIIPIGIEPSVQYAISGLLVHHLTEDTAEPLMKFINRLPKEFQAMTLSSAVKANVNLLDHHSINEWCIDNGDLFSQ